MADGILQLLEYYECVPQIFAVCCDTTFSNTGHLAGAIKMLTDAINLPLLWFMCRRHMLEIHITHFMTALTHQKTKGPRRGIYVKLQSKWPEYKNKIDKMDNIKKFDWKTLTVGSALYQLALDALEYGKRALVLEKFARGDYKQLCELMVFYLGGEVQGFKFHQPGACHEAR